MSSNRFRAVAVAALLMAASTAFAADKPTLRPEVGTPLTAAQKALAAKDYAGAKSELDKAAAVGSLTPYESLVLNQLKAQAAGGSGDYKSAMAAYDGILASSALPANQKVPMLDAYARTAYAAKDYNKTGDLIQKYKAAGGNNPETLNLESQALYLGGKCKDATTEINAQVAAAEAAGKHGTETQLGLLAQCALQSKDMNAYTNALEKLVVIAPKKDTWLDLISRTTHKPGFSDRLELDVDRLRRALGLIEKDSDYMESTQLALQAEFPGEAQKFIDEGYQKKLLGTGPEVARQQRLKDLVAKKTAEDKPKLDAAAKDAATQATGDALLKVGFDYVAYGDYAKGLPLMDQGIKKGGLKLPDQAKLHLGYAYLLAGKKDQAISTFNTVQGTDGSKNLAHLWIVQMKAPPIPAAKAAPAAKKK